MRRDAVHALRRLASGAVLAMALALSVAKFWCWSATGSVALLTSAADAVVDLLATSATFAAQVASPDRRFGYGRGEALAAYTQAVLLVSAALVLAIDALQRRSILSP
jgi:ferrous-iron efflux pump FieF